MRTITFGTEGYRGIIGYDFDFQTVGRITRALSQYIRENNGRRLLVGYDTRFLSKEFAQHAASTAARQGLEVLLSDSFCPSPVLSNATRGMHFNGGVMITASHNPPRYNGIKFKSHYGGAVPTSVTNRLSALIAKTPDEDTPPGDYNETMDIRYIYRQDIERFINRKLHNEKKLKVVIDPMYGSGQGLLAHIFGDLGHDVVEIRNIVNPSFGGTNPEPVEKNLAPLKEAVVSNKADIGIALDGDADRIALVDENGEYVDAHRVFGLMIMYLVEEMGMNGEVAKTVSSTGMINKLCEHYNLKLHTTKIGFKYICELMQQGNVMIGGEESGGIGIAAHIPERDGLLAGILITQMMLGRKKSLRGLVDGLYAITGRHYYRRKDISVPASGSIDEIIQKNTGALLRGFGEYELDELDGRKFSFKTGGFLMVRASGTEPVLRIYAEAGDQDKADMLVNEFIARLGTLPGGSL